ncbi:MAG: hydroxymethylbilane synthase [Desulfobacterales bacterium]|jgi:hydroxymethylbilane synthase
MTDRIHIGTRGSQLALWQANWVKDTLKRHHPGIHVELTVIKTKGDKILDVPLAKVGGKGLFVKEIEEALLDGRIDLAVHSMKDMPSDIPEGLAIGAVPARENPKDALIAASASGLSGLPEGAVIGTSSLRRGSQILHIRPDLRIRPLRGNLDTRLRKLDTGDFDAIILAAAGVRRLGLASRITELLEEQIMLPAVGQGALCVEIRQNDPRVHPLIAPLEDWDTRCAVTAERSFLHRLEGGCQVPIAGHASVDGDEVELTGLVADLSGQTVIKSMARGPVVNAGALGLKLAETLLDRGAKTILNDLQQNMESQ